MSFRLPAKIQAALRRAADEEQRSVSNLIVRIATEWLIAHGHLPKSGLASKKKRS
jgi:hypothetical protein